MTRRAVTEVPAVWVDASGPELCVAVWGANGGLTALPVVRTGRSAAARGLFDLIESALSGADTELAAVRTWLFCRGPGSALGLRVAVLALQTWAGLPSAQKPRFLAAYATDVLAAALPPESRGTPGWIAFPQGRLAWSVQRRGPQGEPLGIPQRLEATEALALRGPVYHPAGHKRWHVVPDNFIEVPANPLAVVQALAEGSLPLQAVESPEVFPGDAPQFKRWQPRSAAPASG